MHCDLTPIHRAWESTSRFWGLSSPKHKPASTSSARIGSRFRVPCGQEIPSPCNHTAHTLEINHLETTEDFTKRAPPCRSLKSPVCQPTALTRSTTARHVTPSRAGDFCFGRSREGRPVYLSARILAFDRINLEHCSSEENFRSEILPIAVGIAFLHRPLEELREIPQRLCHTSGTVNGHCISGPWFYFNVR